MSHKNHPTQSHAGSRARHRLTHHHPEGPRAGSLGLSGQGLVTSTLCCLSGVLHGQGWLMQTWAPWCQGLAPRSPAQAWLGARCRSSPVGAARGLEPFALGRPQRSGQIALVPACSSGLLQTVRARPGGRLSLDTNSHRLPSISLLQPLLPGTYSAEPPACPGGAAWVSKCRARGSHTATTALEGAAGGAGAAFRVPLPAVVLCGGGSHPRPVGCSHAPLSRPWRWDTPVPPHRAQLALPPGPLCGPGHAATPQGPPPLGLGHPGQSLALRDRLFLRH